MGEGEWGWMTTFTDLSANTPTEWHWWNSETNEFSSDQNPTQINLEGTYNITLVASNGDGSDSLSKDITFVSQASTCVIPAITVTGISPDTGSNTTAYLPVTITGTGFANDVTVSAGIFSLDSLRNFTVVSDTEITGDLNLVSDPPIEAGVYSIYVLVTDYGPVTLSDAFTVTSSTPTPTPTPTVTPYGCSNVTLHNVEIDENSTSWKSTCGNSMWGVDYENSNVTYYQCGSDTCPVGGASGGGSYIVSDATAPLPAMLPVASILIGLLFMRRMCH